MNLQIVLGYLCLACSALLLVVMFKYGLQGVWNLTNIVFVFCFVMGVVNVAMGLHTHANPRFTPRL